MILRQNTVLSIQIRPQSRIPRRHVVIFLANVKCLGKHQLRSARAKIKIEELFVYALLLNFGRIPRLRLSVQDIDLNLADKLDKTSYFHKLTVSVDLTNAPCLQFLIVPCATCHKYARNCLVFE